MSRSDKIIEAASIKDEAKQYTKKGRMLVFKKPIDIGGGVALLARGRDVNGNALVRFTKGASSARSVQLGSEWSPTADDMLGMDNKDNARMLKHLKTMAPKMFESAEDSTLPEIRESYYGVADELPSLTEALQNASDADLKGLGDRAKLVNAAMATEKAFSKLAILGRKL